MKILFVSHFIPFPPTGGASQRNYNILKKLSELGHEIVLVTLTQRARHHDRRAERRAVEGLTAICRAIHVFQIPTDTSRAMWYALLLGNMFSRTPYSAWRFLSVPMARELGRQLSASFDIAHYDTIALLPYRLRFPGSPAVLNHHNVESSLLLRRSANARRVWERWYLRHQWRKLRNYERASGEAFRNQIVVSEFDKRELLELCPSANIDVVPNGTDIAYFRKRVAPRSSQALVFAGSMGWYPNADAMIHFAKDIWPTIRRRAPGATMNLVGSHPPAELVRIIRGDSRFRVLGFVDDVRPIIGDAAVYVVPIRVGGGTRLKIVDAMAQGKAVVSTTVGAEGLLVQNGRDIVLADEPESFAERVLELLSDVSAREALGEHARETVERVYSWDSIVPVLQNTYERVVAGAMDHRAAE